MTETRPPWNLWLPFFIGGLYMIGQLAMGIVAFAIYWIVTIPTNQKPTTDGFLAWPPITWVVLGAAAISAAVALAFTWVFLRLRVERPMTALGFTKGRIWLLALTPPLTFLVMVGMTASVTLIFGMEEVSVETQEMLFETPLLGFVSALVVSTLAPLIEEVLFRSLLFEPVRYRLGKGWAVMISAALFAVAHLPMVTSGEAIMGLLMIWFLLGVFLGALRTFTGTLWGPVLAHTTWNAIASLAALLAQSLPH